MPFLCSFLVGSWMLVGFPRESPLNWFKFRFSIWECDEFFLKWKTFRHIATTSCFKEGNKKNDPTTQRDQDASPVELEVWHRRYLLLLEERSEQVWALWATDQWPRQRRWLVGFCWVGLVFVGLGGAGDGLIGWFCVFRGRFDMEWVSWSVGKKVPISKGVMMARNIQEHQGKQLQYLVRPT